MLVIGAVCGMGLAGSYRAVFDAPEPRRWFSYEAEFLGLTVLILPATAVLYPTFQGRGVFRRS